MTAIERDHPRLRQVRDLEPGETLPLNEQFRCEMCGGLFFLAASLERHKQGEVPGFVAWAESANAAWEQTRRGHPLVPRGLCE